MTIVGEVAVGVASGLVHDALKRPFGFLAEELKRRNQVGRALTDKQVVPPQTPDIDAVFSDLSRIIGNSTGNLTVDVSQFLRELKMTALPEAIGRAALLDADPSAILAPFEQFYNQYNDLPFTAKQLFNGLHEACRQRVNSVRDQAMLDIIRAQHKELTVQLVDIARSLSLSTQPTIGLTHQQIRDFRLRLAGAIEIANRYVNVETMRGTKKYPLKSLAISSRLGRLKEQEIISARYSDREFSIPYIHFRRQVDRNIFLAIQAGASQLLLNYCVLI